MLMKRCIILIVVLLSAGSVWAAAKTKKGSNCRHPEYRNLLYRQLGADSFLHGDVNKGGVRVMWFQMFDQVGNASILTGYRKAKQKVGPFPAKLMENKWVWMLVNDRLEIRLVADHKSKEFQSTAKLKEFLLSFDIPEMKKVSGPKMRTQDLQKFLPLISERCAG